MTTPPQYPSAPEPGQEPPGMPPFAGGEPQQAPSRGMAIAALVLGIVSVVLFVIPPITIPAGVLAIVFGIISLRRAGRHPAGRKGMPIVGLVLGIIGVIVAAGLVAYSVQQRQHCEDTIGHAPSSAELQQCIRDGV